MKTKFLNFIIFNWFLAFKAEVGRLLKFCKNELQTINKVFLIYIILSLTTNYNKQIQQSIKQMRDYDLILEVLKPEAWSSASVLAVSFLTNNK